MKFLIGSQNFGLDMPDSDKDYFQFYYPELGDLCGRPLRDRDVKEENGSVTKYIDIRNIPSRFYKSNLNILQLLYSKEVAGDDWLQEYFRKNEENIGSLNIPRLYNSTMGIAQQRFKRQTSKDLAHIIFGFQALIQFEEQGFTNLRSCFEHDSHRYYSRIRSEDYNAWLISAKEWEKLAKNKEDSYMSVKPNDEFMKKFEEDVAKMVLNKLNTKHRN